MSGKPEAGHEDIDNDPLPSPLTTRNLRPRLSQSLARAAYRDASRSQRLSRDPSFHHSNTPAMQFTTSSSNVGSSTGNQTAESSEMAVRTRRRQAKRRRVTSEDIFTSDGVDVISSDSDDIPKALSRMDTQATSTASFSSGVVRPSSSTHQQDPSHVPVSSRSLRKILHPTDTESFQKPSPSTEPEVSFSSSSSAAAAIRTQVSSGTSPPAPEYLAEYTCPICFFPPTNATLTPCGHICCGECLFTAVKSTLQRGTLFNNADANVARSAVLCFGCATDFVLMVSFRCPVCRAPIHGWDGRGGGVIGLKARSLLSL